MKYFATLFLMLIAVLVLEAQEPRYQTYSTALSISGIKNGEKLVWQNKNINIILNYKTGGFLAKLTSADFLNNSDEQAITNTENISSDREFTLEGEFPIDALIDQQNITGNYQVELQLSNQELDLQETILFSMTVTKPGQSQTNYRIFVLQGTLLADQVNLPAFEGFDNEVKLKLFFNSFWEQ